MYKKLISILLVVVLLFTCCVVSVTAIQPTITVSSVRANPGDIVDLEVCLESNPGINTFTLGFDCDKTNLELLDVTINKNLGGQFVYKERAVWLNNKDTKYNGEILALKFKVLDSAENGEYKINVTYSPGDISNYDEQDVNFNIKSGTIMVDNSETKVSFTQKILSLIRELIERIKELFSLAN